MARPLPDHQPPRHVDNRPGSEVIAAAGCAALIAAGVVALAWWQARPFLVDIIAVGPDGVDGDVLTLTSDVYGRALASLISDEADARRMVRWRKLAADLELARLPR